MVQMQLQAARAAVQLHRPLAVPTYTATQLQEWQQMMAAAVPGSGSTGAVQSHAMQLQLQQHTMAATPGAGAGAAAASGGSAQ